MIQKLCRQVMIGAALAFPIVSVNSQTAWADRRDFTVQNNNELAIVRVYVSPANSNYWGGDILGRDILPSGQSTEITFSNSSEQCIYDIKAVYENRTYDLGRANLCDTYTINFFGNGGDYR
jgi:hypothetical protein